MALRWPSWQWTYEELGNDADDPSHGRMIHTTELVLRAAMRPGPGSPPNDLPADASEHPLTSTSADAATVS